MIVRQKYMQSKTKIVNVELAYSFKTFESGLSFLKHKWLLVFQYHSFDIGISSPINCSISCQADSCALT